MISINYTVHSAQVVLAEVDAEVAGQPARVKIDRLALEIVSDDGSMSHVLRIDDTPANRARYAVGSEITLVDAAGPDEEPEVESPADTE